LTQLKRNIRFKDGRASAQVENKDIAQQRVHFISEEKYITDAYHYRS